MNEEMEKKDMKSPSEETEEDVQGYAYGTDIAAPVPKPPAIGTGAIPPATLGSTATSPVVTGVTLDTGTGGGGVPVPMPASEDPDVAKKKYPDPTSS